MKQIRVAVTDANDCFRCEGILDDMSIPFKLIVQADNHLLIGIEDQFSRLALDALHRAGLTATDDI
jgi:hypothetical protein